MKQTIKGSSYGGNDAATDETEARANRISHVFHVVGESYPRAPEKVAAGGGRGGRHGLKVSPSCLLDESIADADLIPRVDCGGGGGGRIHGGGGREKVFEGGVGFGFEREQLEINVGDCTLWEGEAGALALCLEGEL